MPPRACLGVRSCVAWDLRQACAWVACMMSCALARACRSRGSTAALGSVGAGGGGGGALYSWLSQPSPSLSRLWRPVKYQRQADRLTMTMME